jgi:hypothetical protein
MEVKLMKKQERKTCYDGCINLKTGWLGGQKCRVKRHPIENSYAAEAHGNGCKLFAVSALLIVFVAAVIAAPQIERHPENTAANKQRKSSATVVAEAKKAADDSRKAANAAQNVPALRQAVADLAATVSHLCQVVETLTGGTK